MQSKEFRDFEAFATSVRGVESKMLSRNPKRRTWSISTVALGGIDVQLGRLGSGNIAQGQLRPDGFMFYAPLTSEAKYSANGIALKKKSFAILEPGCEFYVSTEIEHDWLTACIPSHMLPQFRPGLASRSCRVSGSTGLVANHFQTVLDQIFSTAASCPGFESSPAAECAAVELVKVCALIAGYHQPIEPPGDGRPKYSREQIIRCSMELIENTGSQLTSALSVKDLAAAANVSERTLRSSFQEYFDIGPTRYLQLRRLHQVHDALRTAKSEESSVSEVLLDHGEWAFGHFAKRYKALFGELPSQTLQNERSLKGIGRSLSSL